MINQVSLLICLCFPAHALHTLVTGSESCAQMSLPHNGQLVTAGLPQMLHIPIIDIAVAKRLRVK